MAHNTTQRRNLAASMDPTLKKHHHHQQPNPADPSIQSISNHFSNLYSNHKSLSVSLDSSSPAAAALTKSKSHHGRKLLREVTTIKKSQKGPDFSKKVKDEVKKVEPNLQGIGVVKKSHGGEVKEFEKQQIGGCEEVKRPSISLELGAGRRRSFCNSQFELADFFSCNSVKVVSVDMPPFMQIHAVDCARKVYDSLEKFTSKALAFSLKKEFDGVYGPAWHCIVGTSFGSFVTHSVGGFIYFSMDHKLYVLLFKTTVQRAD